MKIKWDPKDYHDNSTAQYKIGKEFLDKLNLNGHEKILDIGSGDGRVTAEISTLLVKKGYIVGIDSSDEMVRFARDIYPKVSFHSLYFKTKDAADLAFEDEFDMVISVSALNWIKEQPAVLKGIKRALKNGGKARLWMGGKGNLADYMEILLSVMRDNKWKQYFKSGDIPIYNFSEKEYTQWIKDAGMIMRRVELVDAVMIHDSLDLFKGWIKITTIPFAQRIPHQMMEEFLMTIAGNYLEKHPAEADGKITLAMKRLEVEFDKK